jgi:uncharacterized membrane protein YdfJ with MMPL/SSD domain
MTGLSTTRLARACDRHPWRTLGMWGVVLVLSIVAIGALLGNSITTDADVTADTESKRGYELIGERLPDPNYVDELIVVRSERATVDDPDFDRFVADIPPREDARIIGDPQPSEDRHALLIPIQLTEDPSDRIEGVIEAVRRADAHPAFDVAITGEFTLDRDLMERSQKDLEEGELYFGLPAALVILVLVFGAVVAGLVPVLLALVSIVVALALTALLGQVSPLSFFVVNMISGMGLALGIDYSLFIVSRYREERRHGRARHEAIESTAATSSRAVFVSGMVFVVSMLGMVLVPDTIMRSLAVGAILVGIASVAAALTLLPAVLSVLGNGVNALRVPIVGRAAEAGTAREGRFWRSVIRAVMRRPGLSLAVVAALLLAAASPVLTLNTGTAGVSTLADEFESKRGFLALERDFAGGQTDPVLVVVDSDVDTAAVRAALARLRERMGAIGAFGPSSVRVEPERNIALVSAPVEGDPTRNRAREAIETLRNDAIPQAFAGADAEVLVTGRTAEEVDYSGVIGFWMPIVFAFVLAVTFLLLTVVFRSIVVAAKAMVLNLLSVGAAYGLLVLVFQHGVGAGLLGFQQVDAVEAWVPLFLFSVLFGLSMDYHVFILSRIREGYLATGDTEDAVAHGVASTARLITGAALIIIAVFVGFATGELVMFQQMGFGVAVALAIDATLVRSVLLPAAMKLLGARNWYLPRWLEWLPRLGVERPVAEAAS